LDFRCPADISYDPSATHDDPKHPPGHSALLLATASTGRVFAIDELAQSYGP
jgi:hypothetical protein